MRNKEVAYAFINREAASGSNLMSTGDRLYSYNTCIAQYDDDNTLYINYTKYSSTTSRHQGYLMRQLRGVPHKEVFNVPQGVHNIKVYYED